jgi:hypothetical protein
MKLWVDLSNVIPTSCFRHYNENTTSWQSLLTDASRLLYMLRDPINKFWEELIAYLP